MKRTFGLIGALVVLTLSGCATLSENQCRRADWSGIGFADGRDGHSATRFIQHEKACAKYGITPDRRAYFDAREDGLREYCTPQHGFDEGLAGNSYENVCPTENPLDPRRVLGLTDPSFEQAYAVGRDIWSTRADLSSIESELADIDSKLASRDTKPEDNEKLRARRATLYREREDKKDELKRLERKADRHFF